MPPRVISRGPILVATLLCSSTAPGFAHAAREPNIAQPVRNDDVGAAVAEASLRFGLPQSWIRAFIRAESFGNVRAVSPKGAIGLMQLMPSTYAALRLRLGLGPDPFEIHDNITAGAAYMRLLLDRYGVAGMIGAYNAGPARWEAHLAGVRHLPVETIGYVSRVGPLLGVDTPALLSASVPVAPLSPAEAPLFVVLLSASDAEKPSADRVRILSVIAANPTVVPASRSGSDGPAQVEAMTSSGAPVDVGARDQTTTNGARPVSAARIDRLFVAATPRQPDR